MRDTEVRGVFKDRDTFLKRRVYLGDLAAEKQTTRASNRAVEAFYQHYLPTIPATGDTPAGKQYYSHAKNTPRTSPRLSHSPPRLRSVYHEIPIIKPTIFVNISHLHLSGSALFDQDLEVDGLLLRSKR